MSNRIKHSLERERFISFTKMLPACVAALFCLMNCCICHKTWPEPVVKNRHKSGGTELSRVVCLLLREKTGNTMENRKYILLEI